MQNRFGDILVLTALYLIKQTKRKPHWAVSHLPLPTAVGPSAFLTLEIAVRTQRHKRILKYYYKLAFKIRHTDLK